MEGNSNSRSTGSGTESSGVGKGCCSSSIGSSHEGRRGLSNAFSRTRNKGSINRRMRHKPTNCVYTFEALTPSRVSRTEEEVQGLKIGH